MKTRPYLLQGASAALLAAVFGANGAAAEDADVLVLDEINVSGSGLPTEVRNSVASVTVVSEEEIKRVPPKSIGSVLAEVPGVRVSESGIERISIRGEASNRVTIMIDGQRISDHTNYGTPVLIAPADIERIEVVRGPSSVVSGNSAIGGVVNIITKRGADVPLEINANAGYIGANDGYRGSLSAAGSMGNFDYRLSVSKSDLNDRETADGPLEPSGSSDRDIRAFLGYRMDNQYFGLRAQDFDISADVYTGDQNFLIELPKRDLRKYSGFYEGTDLTPWMSLFKVELFDQTVDREFSNDITIATGPSSSANILSTSVDDQTTRGVKLTANMEFAPGHRTVIGAELEDDRLISDKATTTTGFGPFPSTTTRYSDASIRTGSAFAQHEASFGNLTAIGGMRFYSVDSSLDSYLVDGVAQPTQDNSDSRFLGSAGLVYELAGGSILRANISQGYNYPSLSQLYLTTSGGGGTIIGNPDLKPESATNYEIGYRMNHGALTLDATLFHTDSSDYIATQSIGGGVSEYRNVDSADTTGVELAVEYDTGLWGGLRPYASLSNTRRTFTYSNGYSTHDTGTPEWAGTVGLRSGWEAAGLSGTWDLFLRGESEATQRDDSGAIADPSNDHTGGWTTVNLRGSVDLSSTVSVTIEAANLTDRSYRSFDQIEAAGRNVSVFVNARF